MEMRKASTPGIGAFVRAVLHPGELLVALGENSLIVPSLPTEWDAVKQECPGSRWARATLYAICPGAAATCGRILALTDPCADASALAQK